MQSIQKFKFNQKYCAINSRKKFELVERNDNYLVFRVRKPGSRETYKTAATSTYKANEFGAFEEVFLPDGVRVRAMAA